MKLLKNLNPFILVILLAIIMSVIFNEVNNTINQAKYKGKELIGNEVVINKDTLIIINYNLFKETVTLSNGTEVSYDYLKINTKSK